MKNAILFLMICTIIIISYILTILYLTKDLKKNNKKDAEEYNIPKHKKIIALIILILLTIISILIMPENSTDIYYYMAVGRADSKYNENSYKTLFIDIQKKYPDDEIISSSPSLDVKFTYGALWRFICQILSSFPTNSTITLLMVYKIVNAIIHISNCYLIYKISKKNKLRNALIYGLNPLVLFEGIINCHNDMYIVFSILLALYFREKEKIGLSIVSITAGILIKYVPIILLPFIIQKQNWKKRAIYVLELVVLFMTSSLMMLGNFNDIFSFLQQTGFYANSIYVFTLLISENKIDLVAFIGKILFVVIYLYKIIKLEKTKEKNNSDSAMVYKNLLILFLFLVITNFRAWYIMWLFGLIPVLKVVDIKEIIAISFAGEIANVIYYSLGDSYIYSMFYFLIFAGACVIGTEIITHQKNNRKTIAK